MVTVHFKHSIADKVKNLFRRKDKRFPAVAVFTDYSEARYTGDSLIVEWGNSTYFYPHHTIKRVKFVK